MADLKRYEELVVITKTYDLILWSCNHTGKFPRNHRFVLGERIERNLYDLLEILIRAKYTRQRQPLLEQANLVLEILRFQMRLAKDLQCLRSKAMALLPKAIDEIGKLVAHDETPQQPLATCQFDMFIESQEPKLVIYARNAQTLLQMAQDRL